MLTENSVGHPRSLSALVIRVQGSSSGALNDFSLSSSPLGGWPTLGLFVSVIPDGDAPSFRVLAKGGNVEAQECFEIGRP